MTCLCVAGTTNLPQCSNPPSDQQPQTCPNGSIPNRSGQCTVEQKQCASNDMTCLCVLGVDPTRCNNIPMQPCPNGSIPDRSGQCVVNQQQNTSNNIPCGRPGGGPCA
jgi:hypothetical protein